MSEEKSGLFKSLTKNGFLGGIFIVIVGIVALIYAIV